MNVLAATATYSVSSVWLVNTEKLMKGFIYLMKHP